MGVLGNVEDEQKWFLEKKGSWWEVLETDLSVPLWCYLNLQILFISTCFHARCLSLVLLSTMTVALQPSQHPMAQRSSVCCAARWQNARLWEKMWPWSNATEQAMTENVHTLQLAGLDDWKLSGSLFAPIFWWWNWYPHFLGGSISQTNWGCHKLPNIHPFHCQAQPWEILLRSVLNVLFMAKALRWVATTGVTKFWDLIWWCYGWFTWIMTRMLKFVYCSIVELSEYILLFYHFGLN